MQTVVVVALPDRLRLDPGVVAAVVTVALLPPVLLGRLAGVGTSEASRVGQPPLRLEFSTHFWVEQAAEQPLRGWQILVERRR